MRIVFLYFCQIMSYQTLLINNLKLSLSRNIFFYKSIKLPDIFETRIYLIFIHFSIMMIVFKNKGQTFEQKKYDSLFHNIEYNLRELGFGDVSVNSKMKEFNKILYDILLKLESKENLKGCSFKLNSILIKKYFDCFKNEEKSKFDQFEAYFLSFYNFCFELSPENMLKDLEKFKY